VGKKREPLSLLIGKRPLPQRGHRELLILFGQERFVFDGRIAA
jgi:hypothetical protein